MELKNIAVSDWQEIFKNKNVIIFGAGIAGKAVLKILKSKGINVFGFQDNGAAVPYKIENIPVSRMDFSKIDNQKFIFVLAIHNMDEAIKQLEEVGKYDWIAAYQLLNEETKAELSFMEVQKIEAIYFYFERFINKELLTLNSLDFVITERCSLRCKECSNLMQYYSAPKNFSVETLKNELDSLCNVLDEIYEIRLIGGEPFVNPNWNEILQYVATKDKIKRISIYTNGTILPNDSQCEILKESNAWLSISDYDELSRNLKPLQNKLDLYSIPYEVKGVPYWTRCSSFVKHDRTPKELLDVFKKCCARNLATLLRGKLYPCPFISNAMNLSAIPQVENDYVDLTENVDVEVLRQKVRRLMTRPFYNSCEWCEGRPTPEDIKDEDKIPPHEQINKPLPYIRYDDSAPKLNVVIPVYNVEKYLGQCLDSVLNQTFKNFQVILVDDGSTDNSLAICEDYQKKDNRIKVINQSNQGPSSARNRAFSEIEMKNGGGLFSFY